MPASSDSATGTDAIVFTTALLEIAAAQASARIAEPAYAGEHPIIVKRDLQYCEVIGPPLSGATPKIERNREGRHRLSWNAPAVAALG